MRLLLYLKNCPYSIDEILEFYESNVLLENVYLPSEEREEIKLLPSQVSTTVPSTTLSLVISGRSFSPIVRNRTTTVNARQPVPDRNIRSCASFCFRNQNTREFARPKVCGTLRSKLKLPKCFVFYHFSMTKHFFPISFNPIV